MHSLNIVAGWLVLGLGMMDGLSRDHLSSLAPWSITDKVIGKYFSLQMFPRLGQRQANSLTVQQRVCLEDNMHYGSGAVCKLHHPLLEFLTPLGGYVTTTQYLQVLTADEKL